MMNNISAQIYHLGVPPEIIYLSVKAHDSQLVSNIVAMKRLRSLYYLPVNSKQLLIRNMREVCNFVLISQYRNPGQKVSLSKTHSRT